MVAALYPVFIIHQAILMAIAYYVVMLAIPPPIQFATILIFSILLTFACYEFIRRIPVVRAIFGITHNHSKTNGKINI